MNYLKLTSVFVSLNNAYFKVNPMNAKWYFKEFSKGDTERDPIQGEFFSSESIEKPAHALIREGIQNSSNIVLSGQ